MGNNHEYILYADISNVINREMVLLHCDREYWHNPTNQLHQIMMLNNFLQQDKDHADVIQYNYSKTTKKQKAGTNCFRVDESNYDVIVVDPHNWSNGPCYNEAEDIPIDAPEAKGK